jgi:hypothetical protein
LGPGGGVNGGEIVAEGTPEQVANEPRSFTGQYLRPVLAKSPVQPTPEIKVKARARRKASVAEEPDLLAAK